MINNEIVLNFVSNFEQKKCLSVDDYEIIKKMILKNKEDIFNFKIENIPKLLLDEIEEHEIYYGFTENEIKNFLINVNRLGYTFNYINLSTKNNQFFNHSFKPYALRKI